MVHDSVDDRGGHLVVSEHGAPSSELEVRGEDEAAFLVRVGDHLEQQSCPFGIDGDLVETDLNAAQFIASASHRPTARSIIATRSAQATANEEASGAGLVNFGMLVTATVTNKDRLPQAKAAINTLGATARIRLRPCYGAQDSAFTAALPLGLVLPKYLSPAATLKDKL